MDDYMIANSQAETANNNVVAAVLFDYRGLDTLGEATVLFTAVTGVLLLFRALKKREKKT
jgi:multisubunit Na+/H+ antiporter MnhB subunit